MKCTHHTSTYATCLVYDGYAKIAAMLYRDLDFYATVAVCIAHHMSVAEHLGLVSKTTIEAGSLVLPGPFAGISVRSVRALTGCMGRAFSKIPRPGRVMGQSRPWQARQDRT